MWAKTHRSGCMKRSPEKTIPKWMRRGKPFKDEGALPPTSKIKIFNAPPRIFGKRRRVWVCEASFGQVRGACMMRQVVDPLAYSLSSSAPRISPVAMPVERPAWVTVPVARTVIPKGMARVMFTLYSSVV